ncbi:hypothetical protein SRHO_G00091060, partial [Serrasalmus rhombeus]
RRDSGGEKFVFSLSGAFYRFSFGLKQRYGRITLYSGPNRIVSDQFYCGTAGEAVQPDCGVLGHSNGLRVLVEHVRRPELHAMRGLRCRPLSVLGLLRFTGELREP